MNSLIYEFTCLFIGMLLVRSLDLFNYHNGIIDDEPDGSGNRTQRHDI